MIQQQPDVIEVGRVLATLDDWRAIAFVLVVLVIASFVERTWYGASIRRERNDMAAERERMWKVSEKFGAAADKNSDATNKIVTELEVARALNARIEGAVERLEERVSELGRGK